MPGAAGCHDAAGWNHSRPHCRQRSWSADPALIAAVHWLRLAGLVLCGLLVCSGCAVGGRSVSIDSDSRVPQFGLQLVPRKAEPDPSTYRSIALTDRHAAQVRLVTHTLEASSQRLSLPSLPFPRTDVDAEGQPVGTEIPLEF